MTQPTLLVTAEDSLEVLRRVDEVLQHRLPAAETVTVPGGHLIDPAGAPVLYIFRTVRNPKAPGGAEFVPEMVHNRSGVGSSVLAADVNKDGALDILTATKLGIFAFLNTPRR